MAKGVAKVPRWESELWAFVSSGDGMHCPLLNCCQVRQSGEWCFDDYGEHYKRAIDSEQFNPHHFDFIKAGTCPRLSKEVKMLANWYLQRGECCGPPVPEELVSLADDDNPIEIRLVPLKAFHSAIWRLHDRWVIQLRTDDTPARQRFSLFHEVFHILAHCSTTPVFQKIGAVRGYFNEHLADYFAVCVLLPEKWIREKWVKTKDLGIIAKLFDVPTSVMYARLKRLGLV